MTKAMSTERLDEFEALIRGISDPRTLDREDVPCVVDANTFLLLIAEVRRLQSENETLRDEIDDLLAERLLLRERLSRFEAVDPNDGFDCCRACGRSFHKVGHDGSCPWAGVGE